MINDVKNKIIIKNDRIQDIEGNGNLLRIIGNDFDLEFDNNAVAYPGFVDSHGHIAGYGMQMSEIDLSVAKSFEECIEIASRSGNTRGNWIVGYSWNQENWDNPSFPTAASLDAAFPSTPVFFLRVDGHSAVINTAAMNLAKIDKYTENPDGGLILKDKAGNPNGLLVDNAVNLAKSLIPDYTFEQTTEFISLAVKELAKFGISEVHDMDVETSLIPIYQDLEFRKQLPIRISAFAKAQNNEWLRDNVIAYAGNMFSVKGLKYFTDGALGSRGAALLRHYEDDSSTDGVMLLESQQLFTRAKRGILSGFEIAIHSIGDRSLRMILDVVEKLRTDPLLKGRGVIRIEHSQIVHPDDLPRYKDLKVIASVQPIHFASDTQGMAQKRIGPKLKNSYLWKGFLNEGVELIAGSDFPIESPSPIEGIRTFLHRKPKNSSEALFPQERLSLAEALDAYCLAPQRVSGNDKQRGEIIPGKQADIVVLSNSLETIEKDCNAEVRVLATIVNGKLVYKA